jgi:hypothetical protein
LQGVDFFLQGGDVLDLLVEFSVLGGEHAVPLFLDRDAAGVPAADQQHDGHAEQAAEHQHGDEGRLLLFAFRFPVRKQINADHQPNLRRPRPQATR